MLGHTVMMSDPGKTIINYIDQPGLADGEGEAAPVMATACRRIDRQPSDWRARHSWQGMEALDLAANDPRLMRIRAPEVETPPEPLTATLDDYRARIEERDDAAERLAGTLDSYAAIHARYCDDPSLQGFHIGLWSARAIANWHALTGTAERDPTMTKDGTEIIGEMHRLDWRLPGSGFRSPASLRRSTSALDEFCSGEAGIPGDAAEQNGRNVA